MNYTTAAGVQQFSITIASGSTTGTVNLGTAVGAGAYINYGGSNPSVTADFAEAGAYLSWATAGGTTTITATRQTGTTGTVVVTGSITDGDTSNLVVAVQQGTVSIAASTSGTASVTAPGSDGNSVIHYLGHSGTGTVISATADDPHLTQSSTTVTATTAGTATLTVGFVLIELQSSCMTANAVQRISATSSSSVASFTASLGANVVLANAISFWGGWSIATVTTDLAEALMYGVLSAVGTFTVHVSQGVADAKTYNASIVEFNSGVLNSAVQRGTTVAAGTSAFTQLTSINESYAGISWLGNITGDGGGSLTSDFGAAILTTETISSTVSVLHTASFSAVATGTAKSITSTTAGSLLAVAISLPGNTSNRTISSVTDSKGQTWTQYPSVSATDSTGNSLTDIWYFPNTVSGVTSVTVNGSGAFNSGAYLTIYEVAGIVTSSATDAGAAKNNGASSASQVTGQITTAQGCDFNQYAGAGNPFTGGGANINGAYYIPPAVVINQTCTFYCTSAHTFCASIASFLAASTATSTVDAVEVIKATAGQSVTGGWEVFEFPAFSGSGSTTYGVAAAGGTQATSGTIGWAG